uniref:Uncharacterized protein n=1 Tax=Meloidogyne enterolobii TaxID=390850 RepID=A0A6V7TY62_MELEN|nr:unnamed protein product [Meloidogyne enterolobii]
MCVSKTLTDKTSVRVSPCFVCPCSAVFSVRVRPSFDRLCPSVFVCPCSSVCSVRVRCQTTQKCNIFYFLLLILSLLHMNMPQGNSLEVNEGKSLTFLYKIRKNMERKK